MPRVIFRFAMAVLVLLLLLAATAAGMLIVARIFYVVPFGQSSSRSCLHLYARSAKLSYDASAPAAYWVQRVMGVCLFLCRRSVRVLSQRLLRGRGLEASVCARRNGGGLLWAAECEVGPEGDRSLGQLQQLW